MDIIKKERSRAIIIKDEKLVSMYREFDNRVFYTFPGGGKEAEESEEECVIREVLEEFGIEVNPIKKVYVYETDKSIEYFYVCEWIKGEFGSGKGEEYDPNAHKEGLYLPTLMSISSIPTLPLMPKEIASLLYEDYLNNGLNLANHIKHVNISNNKR